jgi:hypothetical protein
VWNGENEVRFLWFCIEIDLVWYGTREREKLRVGSHMIIDQTAYGIDVQQLKKKKNK